ncbi:hypothetical protein Q3G72_022853 [Acer saccharum]|nr:hypothetical protein Q3G72_022853 [Acer saccharum]
MLQMSTQMISPLEKRNRRLHYSQLQDCIKAEESRVILVKDGGPPKGKSQCKYPDLDDEEPIHFILKELVVGEALSSKNTPATICLTSSFEDPSGSWELISFTPSDLRGVRYLHCDALIISVKIESSTMKRTLIDHGSSLDIIHWDPLQKLGYTLQQLQALRYCIRGIWGTPH